MQVVIKGKNIEVTDSLREYVEKKMHHIQRHFDNIIEIQVTLNVNRNPSVERSQAVELTALVNGSVMRVEEQADNMYAAIDLAAERLDRQVTRYKERIQEKPELKLVRALERAEEMLEEEQAEGEEQAMAGRIVKRKNFTLKPMFAEDAAIRMEELGHAFFVYRDAETEGISVIYSRRDGNYGVIETR